MRKPVLAYAKTKTQISFAVTAKLISAFVFATRIVQSLNFLNTTFQASSHLLWLYSLVCVRPGQKPRRPVFSQRGSFLGLNVCFKDSIGRLLSFSEWLIRPRWKTRDYLSRCPINVVLRIMQLKHV